MDAKERLLARCHIQEEGCWLFLGPPDSDGYGQFYLAGVTRKAHRAAYHLWKESLPPHLDVHHTCHNRICVNPDHLCALTIADHHAADPRPRPKRDPRTHCRRGHLLTDESTYKCSGGRFCKICQKERLSRQYYERKASR